jgi:U4/U6 small nuclear ribonucleoprotein PRP4
MDVDAKPDVNGAPVEPPLSGSFLVSSGFDGLVKFWSADDWQLVKALASEAGGRATSVDLSAGKPKNPRFLSSARQDSSCSLPSFFF